MSIDLRYVGERDLLPQNSSIVFLNSLWPRWWTEVVNNKNSPLQNVMVCDGATNILKGSLQTIDLKNKTNKQKKDYKPIDVDFSGIKKKELQIVGDFDSITDDSLNWVSKRLAKKDIMVKTIHMDDQNFSDSNKALNELMKMINFDNEKSNKKESFSDKVKNLAEQLEIDQHIAEPPVLLMGAFSGNRIDHMLNNISIAAKFGSNIHLHGQKSSLVVLSKGKSKIELPKNTNHIGLFPLCGSTIVKTEGLKWNLDNEALDFMALVSCSNRLDEKNYKKSIIVETDKPVLLIVEVDK